MTKSDMKKRRTALRNYLTDTHGPDVVMLDGPVFDGGIVGTTRDGKLVYSYEKLARALAGGTGWWSVAEAVDWIEYNTIRSLPYMGDKAPIVMNDLDPDDFAPLPRKRRARK